MAVNTLERVAETLGRGVIDVVYAPHGLSIEVHDVVVHDVVDPFDVKEGDLVLGVGLGTGDETLRILDELAAKRIAAVVVKTPALADGSLVDAAAKAALTLLAVPAGASWSQIVQLTQSVLSHGTLAGDDVRAFSAADLFSLADAIAALIDAPVTIEDRGSRVLAYSGRQEEADAARAETIIGRRVPERFMRKFEAEGVFERLRTEPGCVYIDSIGEDVLPRLAVAVRAGTEMLGSIWAAVPKRPAPDVERAFQESSKVAALHLLRHRAGADVERSLQADLVASVLHGTAGARDAATRLRLEGSAYRVLAAWLSSTDDADEDQARARFRDLLAVHLSSFRVRGAAAVLGGIVYAVVALNDDREGADEMVARIAEEVVARTRSGSDPVPRIGIGGHASRIDEVPRSAREAEEALRVVRLGENRAVASIEQVRLAALLARFAEAAAHDREIYDHKIAPLIESDRRRGTGYIAALSTYFEAFGDYTAAAAKLHIHPNTLRYRLRKVQELSGVRLDDPEERLALMLLLRVLAPSETLS